MVLSGTVLATNAIENIGHLPLIGIVWGFAAAITYAIAITVSNKVAVTMAPEKRCFFMLIGAFITVTLIGLPELINKFDLSIFWTWGIPLAVFGTLPPRFCLIWGCQKQA